jgi:hypothetical protein
VSVAVLVTEPVFSLASHSYSFLKDYRGGLPDNVCSIDIIVSILFSRKDEKRYFPYFLFSQFIFLRVLPLLNWYFLCCPKLSTEFDRDVKPDLPLNIT